MLLKNPEKSSQLQFTEKYELKHEIGTRTKGQNHQIFG